VNKKIKDKTWHNIYNNITKKTN